MDNRFITLTEILPKFGSVTFTAHSCVSRICFHATHLEAADPRLPCRTAGVAARPICCFNRISSSHEELPAGRERVMYACARPGLARLILSRCVGRSRCVGSSLAIDDVGRRRARLLPVAIGAPNRTHTISLSRRFNRLSQMKDSFLFHISKNTSTILSSVCPSVCL